MATWTAEELAAIKAAIATGTTKVQYRDRSVEYRSLEDLFRLKAEMERDLGITTSRSRQHYPKTSKGT